MAREAFVKTIERPVRGNRGVVAGKWGVEKDDVRTWER
jgi:hypothetical protein